ncbi:MAG TPA: FHA domain-containing protein [Steroidobacteraceae bacterium]|nr:FHA domain-containing protein [Steroidobacteraceae bacterium]
MAEKRFILKKLPDGPEIPVDGELCVGRSAESGLKLVEGRPSRNHAVLSIVDGSVFVEDLGSTNGTFVNDKRIDSKVRLKSNDKLRFDVEQYLFRIEMAGSPADRTLLREGEPDLVVASGKARVPEGWLENPQAGNKTLYMSPEQLRQERKRLAALGAVDGALGRVEAPQLIVLGGTEPLRIELKPTESGKKEWSVGSEGEREILLKRVGVSALHAKIVNEGNRWKVIDELSANGTFVNGRRCTMSFLSSTDRITFGSVECIFQLPKGAQSAAANSEGRPWKKLAIGAIVLIVIAAAAWFFLAH